MSTSRADFLLQEIASLEAERACIEARINQAMLEFADARKQEATDCENARQREVFLQSAADEISLILRAPAPMIQVRLGRARRTRDAMPAVWAAHQEGLVDDYRLSLIATAANKLTLDASVDRLDQRVVSYARTHTATQLKGWLNRFVARAEPEASAQRARDARASRGVWVNHADDGISMLSALIPTPDAIRIHALLQIQAKNAPNTDEHGPVTMDQRRADIFVNSLLGDTQSPTNALRRSTVGVVVPISSLLGLDDAPGESVDGSFALPAEVVREIAAAPGTIFHRLLTDARGNLLDVTEINYRPSPALRQAIEFRDGTCLFPTCHRPATDSELDHNIPWPNGPTAAHNLQTLCRRHHNLKTHLGWSRHGPPRLEQ